MDLTSILELDRLAKKDAANYPSPRLLMSELERERGRHYTGILGPRGVGKTVLLKQLAAGRPEAFYLSLDTLARDTDVFEVVKKLHLDYGGRLFLLDEVHFQPGIDETLKKLYDFLDIRVCFTSSVALALHRSAYDLSRRIVLKFLYPFSFREYISFRAGTRIPPLTLDRIFNREWSPDHMRAGLHFESYLRGGLMPFGLDEPEPLTILERILATVIRKDIPATARLHTEEPDLIHKLVGFVGRSPVDGINYSSTAGNLGITKYKAEQYIDLLEKAFVLHRVFPRGTNVLKEPKVLMALPYRLLYKPYASALGGLREDFVVQTLRMAGRSFFYLKTTTGTKTPDYLLDDGKEENTVIEIGGKGKGREQFKGVTADRKIIFAHDDRTDGMRRPLFMLGFLA